MKISSFSSLMATLTVVGVLTTQGVLAQHSPTSLTVIDEAATMADRLGNQAAMDAHFVDEQGQSLAFSELFESGRPVILNLGYFGCPGICTAVLNYFISDLKDSGMLPGEDFDLVTLSIDPDEGPEMARQKKKNYLLEFGHPEVAEHWRFLTGDEEQIHKLTDSVGWRFRFLADSGQFDHPPVLVFLSPRGYSTRYLNALTMGATTLRRAVVEASEGRVGSFLERILLNCLTYDPDSGAYTMTVMSVMRIGGILTVLALGSLIFILWRRERSRTALAVS